MNKPEPIADYLRRRLTEQCGMHNRIARESGVPQATISRVANGRGSPRLSAVQPLLDWFAAHDAAKSKPASRRRRAATPEIKPGESAPTAP